MMLSPPLLGSPFPAQTYPLMAQEVLVSHCIALDGLHEKHMFL